MKERRNKWRKVCKCPRKPGEAIPVDNPLTPVCKTCGNVIVVIERRAMQNEVSFKTGERPKFTGKSNFPYNRLMQSLITLNDTTKCVILEDRKEFNQNKLTQLRRLLQKEGWWVKACKQDGKWNLWVVKSEVQE